MNFPPRARAGCITQQHRVSIEPAQMAEPGLTLLVRQSCSHIPTGPAPRPGAQGGVSALPRGWSTPILRAHISTDSRPHPNPQPELALGPVSSPRQQCSNQLLELEMGVKYFVPGRVQRGWSVDQFGQTNREEQDRPNGSFHFHIPIFLHRAQSVPGHTERGGVRHHILFHKLRNPQVAAMRGFSKTCRNAATFLTTGCWGLALRAGQAHSHQLARETVSSLSALLHPWSAPVQLVLCGFGVR